MSGDEELTIVSVNVSRPKVLLRWSDGDVISSIDKQPVEVEALELSSLNLEGDEQADTRPTPGGGQVHGGPHAAVYAFPGEHYARISELIDRPTGPGFMGENVTTAGMVEADACIGDIWQWGEARLQISAPRGPCYKLGIRMGKQALRTAIRDETLVGWYLRVLTPGRVPTRGVISIESRHPAAGLGRTRAECDQRPRDRVPGHRRTGPAHAERCAPPGSAVPGHLRRRPRVRLTAAKRRVSARCSPRAFCAAGRRTGRVQILQVMVSAEFCRRARQGAATGTRVVDDDGPGAGRGVGGDGDRELHLRLGAHGVGDGDAGAEVRRHRTRAGDEVRAVDGHGRGCGTRDARGCPRYERRHRVGAHDDLPPVVLSGRICGVLVTKLM